MVLLVPEAVVVGRGRLVSSSASSTISSGSRAAVAVSEVTVVVVVGVVTGICLHICAGYVGLRIAKPIWQQSSRAVE